MAAMEMQVPLFKGSHAGQSLAPRGTISVDAANASTDKVQVEVLELQQTKKRLCCV